MKTLSIYRDKARRPLLSGRHANNLFTRLRGLIGRAPLKTGEGLLITPCNAIHTCFMRAPIDVVFLDREGVVLGCRERVAPWHFAAQRGARHTLELAAGAVAALKIRVGDRLHWPAEARQPAPRSAAALVLLAMLIGACAHSGPKGEGRTLELLGAADTAYAQGDWTAAEKHYRALVELVPTDPYAHFRLANCLARQNRLSEAAQAYNQVLVRDPAYAKAHYNLAVLHLLEAERRLDALNTASKSDDPLRARAQKLRKMLDGAAVVYADTASPIPKAALNSRSKAATEAP